MGRHFAVLDAQIEAKPFADFLADCETMKATRVIALRREISHRLSNLLKRWTGSSTAGGHKARFHNVA
jgi:hypothetical protein